MATLLAALLVPPVWSAPVPQDPAVPVVQSVEMVGEEVDCIVAGARYTQLTATLQPADPSLKPKLYFKSKVSDFFYVELTPGVGNFVGKLPPAKMEAQTITYYFTVIGKGGSVAQTREIAAKVVKKGAECKKPAAILPGAPPTVLTAAGAPATAVSGFAAGIAGGGLSTTALIVGGAVVVGGVATTIAVTSGGDTPPASGSQ